MRQIIYDKVKYIADKYKGYIDTEDLMKEGLTNRQIGLLTAEGKLEKVAHGHYWIISPEFSKPCLLYTSPSPRDGLLSRMPSSA